MFLGIDEKSGHVYEGIERAETPAVPPPNVTQAKLIEAQKDWDDFSGHQIQHSMSWMFREDTFDAMTRTRRGRLYQPIIGPQPTRQAVLPHPYQDPLVESVGATGRRATNLYIFTACTALLSKPRHGLGSTLALGTPQSYSAWRIIQTEVLANRCIMVTLKSLSAFGILPNVDASEIPEEFKPSVIQAVERVLDAAFRETPISVIDHCRNAMTMLLSRWLVAQGYERSILAKDLGVVAVAVDKPPYERGCVSRLAHVVARLHVRGKGNEAYAKSLRDPVEEDAELALHALGFALRDIGWAVI